MWKPATAGPIASGRASLESCIPAGRALRIAATPEIDREASMIDMVRRYTTGGLLGALAIAALVQPASLSGQERAQVRAPAAATDRAAAAETDFGVLLGSAGDERRISERLSHRDRAVVANLGHRVRAGATFEEIRGDWTRLVRRAELSSPEDVDELSRWVMREAYGEGGELADIDLQTSQQKQQQARQMMSNMQKAKHDAAMGSIRNLK
jgi:hypothetical protein